MLFLKLTTLPTRGKAHALVLNSATTPNLKNYKGFLMHHIKIIYNSIAKLTSEIRSAHLGAFAAQSAFFLIMAFVPIMLLVASILSVFDVDPLNLLASHTYLSEETLLSLQRLFEEISSHKKALISLGTVFTAWSAGKAFYALAEGFHCALGIKDNRNYFFLRLKGLGFSLVFSFLISSVVIIGVFGEGVIDFLLEASKHAFMSVEIANVIRKMYIFFAFLFVLIMFYRFLPDWETSIKAEKISEKPKITHILGICVISTVFIYVFTVGFSVYLLRFSTFGITYGSFAMLVGIMLWLYILMYALLFGFKLLIAPVQRAAHKQ